jgi:hypothetical protein
MPGRGTSEQFETEYGAISEAQKGSNISLLVHHSICCVCDDYKFIMSDLRYLFLGM